MLDAQGVPVRFGPNGEPLEYEPLRFAFPSIAALVNGRMETDE